MKPVANIEVCFECFGHETEPAGTSDYYDLPVLAELCAELKLPNSPDAGFRKAFNEFSNDFNKSSTNKVIKLESSPP